MNPIRDYHRQAMEVTDDALTARRRGDHAQARELFGQAFECELKAAELVASDLTAEPTRSVLHRSAAALALDAGRLREAERLCAIALSGDPPAAIAEELRDLLEQTYFQRHLELRGVTLAERELQLSIAGNAVGHGMAVSEEFVSRVQTTEKLIYRTFERKIGAPFREQGPVKKHIQEDFQLFMSAPRAGSFAVTFRLGRATKLPGMENLDGVIDEVMSCLALFSEGNEQQLEVQIPEAPYYRNFLGLARQLAPDGREVSMVGLTAVTDGRERKVLIARPSKWVSMTSDKDDPETIKVTGELRFADARVRVKDKIVLVDQENTEHKIIVPEGMMADIVKPLWGDVVIVTGTRRGKRIHLLDIEKAPG